jgi:hypothetical protein
MKIMLLLDDGTLDELVDAPEGYNLSNPIAQAFFMGTLVDGLKRHYDPFVTRELPETKEDEEVPNAL